MTALDITYEDGLRLAELTGQLRGLEYEASHLIAVNADSMILAIILGMLLGALLAAVLMSNFEDRLSERGMSTIVCLSLFGIPALIIALNVAGLDASVHMQMAEVQGQIDAIMARYEVIA